MTPGNVSSPPPHAWRRVALVVVVAVMLPAGCGTTDTAASGPPDTSASNPAATSTSGVPTDAATTTTGGRATPQEALRDGARYVESQFEYIDSASLMIIDYVGRRYGITELSGAAQAAATRSARSDLTPDERSLARLVQPRATMSPLIGTAESRTTDALAIALHCDQIPPPATYLEDLASLAADGGFAATHAALAVGWLNELGCSSAASRALQTTLVISIEAAFHASVGVIDLRAEQSAFALYLGGTSTRSIEWEQSIRSTQHSDGSWGQDGPGSQSSWHTTILAMWALAAQDPSNNTVTMSTVPMLSNIVGS